MISFRLTAEEYDRFRQLCFEKGIPSVSEMARLAINMLLQHPVHASRDALESRVVELEGRIQHLAREVRKLNPASPLLPGDRVRLLGPPAAPASASE